jgi:hypothetical protein
MVLMCRNRSRRQRRNVSNNKAFSFSLPEAFDALEKSIPVTIVLSNTSYGLKQPVLLYSIDSNLSERVVGWHRALRSVHVSVCTQRLRVGRKSNESIGRLFNAEQY